MSELDRYGLLYPEFGETRDVTVYISEGNFKYEVLETVGEESPIAGPASPRTKFRAGETVYVHYKVRNDGGVKAKATIVVTDIDTGAEITRYTTAETDPGYRFEAFKATVGAMPAKDWKLRFAMTP